jgi:DNA polymerase-3 subunit epsilon
MGREGAWADVEESRPLVVLDVEASGLPPGTFPIEIGITYIETGRTRSWLIRPDPQWRSWPWDLAA